MELTGICNVYYSSCGDEQYAPTGMFSLGLGLLAFASLQEVTDISRPKTVEESLYGSFSTQKSPL